MGRHPSEKYLGLYPSYPAADTAAQRAQSHSHTSISSYPPPYTPSYPQLHRPPKCEQPLVESSTVRYAYSPTSDSDQSTPSSASNNLRWDLLRDRIGGYLDELIRSPVRLAQGGGHVYRLDLRCYEMLVRKLQDLRDWIEEDLAYDGLELPYMAVPHCTERMRSRSWSAYIQMISDFWYEVEEFITHLIDSFENPTFIKSPPPRRHTFGNHMPDGSKPCRQPTSIQPTSSDHRLAITPRQGVHIPEVPRAMVKFPPSADKSGGEENWSKLNTVKSREESSVNTPFIHKTGTYDARGTCPVSAKPYTVESGTHIKAPTWKSSQPNVPQEQYLPSTASPTITCHQSSSSAIATPPVTKAYIQDAGSIYRPSTKPLGPEREARTEVSICKASQLKASQPTVVQSPYQLSTASPINQSSLLATATPPFPSTSTHDTGGTHLTSTKPLPAERDTLTEAPSWKPSRSTAAREGYSSHVPTSPSTVAHNRAGATGVQVDDLHLRLTAPCTNDETSTSPSWKQDPPSLIPAVAVLHSEIQARKNDELTSISSIHEPPHSSSLPRLSSITQHRALIAEMRNVERIDVYCPTSVLLESSAESGISPVNDNAVGARNNGQPQVEEGAFKPRTPASSQPTDTSTDDHEDSPNGAESQEELALDYRSHCSQLQPTINDLQGCGNLETDSNLQQSTRLVEGVPRKLICNAQRLNQDLVSAIPCSSFEVNNKPFHSNPAVGLGYPDTPGSGNMSPTILSINDPRPATSLPNGTHLRASASNPPSKICEMSEGSDHEWDNSPSESELASSEYVRKSKVIDEDESYPRLHSPAKYFTKACNNSFNQQQWEENQERHLQKADTATESTSATKRNLTPLSESIQADNPRLEVGMDEALQHPSTTLQVGPFTNNPAHDATFEVGLQPLSAVDTNSDPCWSSPVSTEPALPKPSNSLHSSERQATSVLRFTREFSTINTNQISAAQYYSIAADFGRLRAEDHSRKDGNEPAETLKAKPVGDPLDIREVTYQKKMTRRAVELASRHCSSTDTVTVIGLQQNFGLDTLEAESSNQLGAEDESAIQETAHLQKIVNLSSIPQFPQQFPRDAHLHSQIQSTQELLPTVSHPTPMEVGPIYPLIRTPKGSLLEISTVSNGQYCSIDFLSIGTDTDLPQRYGLSHIETALINQTDTEARQGEDYQWKFEVGNMTAPVFLSLQHFLPNTHLQSRIQSYKNYIHNDLDTRAREETRVPPGDPGSLSPPPTVIVIVASPDLPSSILPVIDCPSTDLRSIHQAEMSISIDRNGTTDMYAPFILARRRSIDLASPSAAPFRNQDPVHADRVPKADPQVSFEQENRCMETKGLGSKGTTQTGSVCTMVPSEHGTCDSALLRDRPPSKPPDGSKNLGHITDIQANAGDSKPFHHQPSSPSQIYTRNFLDINASKNYYQRSDSPENDRPLILIPNINHSPPTLQPFRPSETPRFVLLLQLDDGRGELQPDVQACTAVRDFFPEHSLVEVSGSGIATFNYRAAEESKEINIDLFANQLRPNSAGTADSVSDLTTPLLALSKGAPNSTPDLGLLIPGLKDKLSAILRHFREAMTGLAVNMNESVEDCLSPPLPSGHRLQEPSSHRNTLPHTHNLRRFGQIPERSRTIKLELEIMAAKNGEYLQHFNLIDPSPHTISSENDTCDDRLARTSTTQKMAILSCHVPTTPDIQISNPLCEPSSTPQLGSKNDQDGKRHGHSSDLLMTNLRDSKISQKGFCPTLALREGEEQTPTSRWYIRISCYHSKQSDLPENCRNCDSSRQPEPISRSGLTLLTACSASRRSPPPTPSPLLGHAYSNQEQSTSHQLGIGAEMRGLVPFESTILSASRPNLWLVCLLFDCTAGSEEKFKEPETEDSPSPSAVVKNCAGNVTTDDLHPDRSNHLRNIRTHLGQSEAALITNPHLQVHSDNLIANALQPRSEHLKDTETFPFGVIEGTKSVSACPLVSIIRTKVAINGKPQPGFNRLELTHDRLPYSSLWHPPFHPESPNRTQVAMFDFEGALAYLSTSLAYLSASQTYGMTYDGNKSTTTEDPPRFFDCVVNHLLSACPDSDNATEGSYPRSLRYHLTSQQSRQMVIGAHNLQEESKSPTDVHASVRLVQLLVRDFSDQLNKKTHSLAPFKNLPFKSTLSLKSIHSTEPYYGEPESAFHIETRRIWNPGLKYLTIFSTPSIQPDNLSNSPIQEKCLTFPSESSIDMISIRDLDPARALARKEEITSQHLQCGLTCRAHPQTLFLHNNWARAFQSDTQ